MKYKIVKIAYRNKGITFDGIFIKKLGKLIPIQVDESIRSEIKNKIKEEEIGEIFL